MQSKGHLAESQVLPTTTAVANISSEPPAAHLLNHGHIRLTQQATQTFLLLLQATSLSKTLGSITQAPQAKIAQG
jgi:hypothetical protein